MYREQFTAPATLYDATSLALHDRTREGLRIPLKQKVYTSFIVLLAAFYFMPVIAYANAAEPPSLIIIMKNAPEDVSVSVVSSNSMAEGKKSKTAWETYYTFYKRDLGSDTDIILRVSGDVIDYEQTIGKKYLEGYNNILTLDVSAQTISAGKVLSRSILLVALRVFLTLGIEGIVFFLFGFRDKTSWLAFLLMNLLTQGILNVILNRASPFASYLIFNLVLMEFWVFAAEIIGVLALIKEHGRFRRVSYVLVANLASLVVGGYLITVLPI